MIVGARVYARHDRRRPAAAGGISDERGYGRREFQYYLVNIAAFPSHPEFEGRGALVERKSTRVLFDSTP